MVGVSIDVVPIAYGSYLIVSHLLKLYLFQGLLYRILQVILLLSSLSLTIVVGIWSVLNRFYDVWYCILGS